MKITVISGLKKGLRRGEIKRLRRDQNFRALALLSGGLDSLLAVRLIREEGIEIIGIGFSSPFFSSAAGEAAASRLRIPFSHFDLTDELLKILPHPRYGYGKNLNPCADCHKLMIREAFRRRKELGADFVITGEVLGQRPKSQTRDMLYAVAGGGEKGLLLRPLSARLLPETIPEREGWVNRDKLLDISGRSRKRQLALAEKFGITEYTSPGGGCLLTEAAFCRKMAELKYQEGWKAEYLRLLSLGRHFRLPSGGRVISGRDEKENDRLEKAARRDDCFFQTTVHPGSLLLLKSRGRLNQDDLATAAAIAARYSRERTAAAVKVNCRVAGKPGEDRKITVAPLPLKKLEALRI